MWIIEIFFALVFDDTKELWASYLCQKVLESKNQVHRYHNEYPFHSVLIIQVHNWILKPSLPHVSDFQYMR